MTCRLPTQTARLLESWKIMDSKVPTLKFAGYGQVSSQEATFCFTGVFYLVELMDVFLKRADFFHRCYERNSLEDCWNTQIC